MFQLQLFFLLHCDEWDRVVALPTQVCHRSYIIAARSTGPLLNFAPLYRFSIQYGLLQDFPKLYIILYNNRGVVHVNPTTIRSRPPCMFGEYTSPWVQFKLTTSVVIGTDCIGSYKSNYHTITTTTAPRSVQDKIVYFQYLAKKCISNNNKFVQEKN